MISIKCQKARLAKQYKKQKTEVARMQKEMRKLADMNKKENKELIAENQAGKKSTETTKLQENLGPTAFSQPTEAIGEDLGVGRLCHDQERGVLGR